MSSDLLSEFPVVYETPVAWGEMDALGHVNNIVYFRYFESARMQYFGHMRFWEYMEETGIGPILGFTDCKFRKPLTYPDQVFVGTRVRTLLADRFIMEYRVISEKQEGIVAEGEGVIVIYDYRTRQKATMPLDVKSRIEEIEKRVNK